jgi:hypothetical protein
MPLARVKLALAPLVVPLLVATALAATPISDDPSPTLHALVERVLEAGRCADQGEWAICSIDAFLHDGQVRRVTEGLPAPPFEAVRLSVVVVRSSSAAVVTEVFGRRQHWRREGDVTVIDQVLVSYWGPHRDDVAARRFRLDADQALIGTDALPRDPEAREAVWSLLTRLFLGVRI